MPLDAPTIHVAAFQFGLECGTAGPIPVKITLNGDPYEVDRPMTVAVLLARLEIDPRRVAVEHNLVVLKRATFEAAEVRDGDQIEIVNFVGGG
jgi:thiamine biosynthesis protein ThiS